MLNCFRRDSIVTGCDAIPQLHFDIPKQSGWHIFETIFFANFGIPLHLSALKPSDGKFFKNGIHKQIVNFIIPTWT